MAKVKPTTTTAEAPADEAPATKKLTLKEQNADNPDADAYGRLPYPGLVIESETEGEDDQIVLLETVPDDFNDKLHRPLIKANFKSEDFYFLYKAQLCEQKAIDYRKAAEDYKKLGATADRAKAKRLISMQKRMQELRAQLVAQGVDVESLLGGDESALPGEAEAEAPAETTPAPAPAGKGKKKK